MSGGAASSAGAAEDRRAVAADRAGSGSLEWFRGPVAASRLCEREREGGRDERRTPEEDDDAWTPRLPAWTPTIGGWNVVDYLGKKLNVG